MTRILVTGATGFIGRRVLARLAGTEGAEIHASGLGARGVHAPGVHWHDDDLLAADAGPALARAARPDVLVHLAWEATPGAHLDSPANRRWRAASRELLTACAQAGLARAVVVGSCAECDWRAGRLAPGAPLRPLSRYSHAKDGLRRDAEAIAARTGFALCWARLFFPYGPDQAPGRLLPALAASLARGQRFTVRAGDARRDYLHADDAADALALLAGTHATGIVHVGSGRATRVGGLATVAADALDRRELLDVNAGTGGEPPLVEADSSGLERLGWRPQVELETGVASAARALARQADGRPSPA